jgi:beta-galactosidase
MHQTKPLLKEINGTVPRAKVGIVFSYPQNYAIDIQPQHPDMTYVDTLMTYYKALYRCNVAVDFIQDTADFSRYELVIAPLQYLMTPALADRYAAYVQAGGLLVLTMRTGVKEANNLCMTDAALPGKTLGQVLGLTVPEYDCLRDAAVVIDWAGQQYTGTHWADLIAPTTAEPLATYGSEFYAGTPAITKNHYGAGTAYYVGTELTDDLADRLVAGLSTVAAETIATPAEVEIVHRGAAAKRYYFVLNHTGEQQNITIPAGWQAYFSDQDSGHLAPYSYQVFTEEKN